MLNLVPRQRVKKTITHFPNLHAHTGIGSLGDGFGGVDLWMDALEKRGIKHHFVTDHGTLAAIPWMYREGKKRGIQIHPGMEGYLIEDYDGYRIDDAGHRLPDTAKVGKIVRHRYRHIVLIPMNEIGWKNLIKINNISWTNGRFRGRGRFSIATLFEHNEGLLCLSACIAGVFSQIFQDYYFGRESDESKSTLKQCRKEAGQLIQRFKKVFGDRLYIELMIFHADIQVFVNKELMRLAKKHGVEVVVTNDCHYPEPEHSEWREVLREFKYRSTSSNETRDSDADNEGKDFSRPELYPRSIDDIKFTWSNAGHSKYIEWEDVAHGIKNAFDITKRCTFEMDMSLKLPSFDVGAHPLYKKAMKSKYATIADTEAERLFVYLLSIGYKKRLKQKLSVKAWRKLLLGKKVKSECKYLKQAAYEYRVIQGAGFIDYFLIVEDIIRYCMQERGRLYGQGRGSVAGSVIAWMLEISRDDPIKYGLFFERFMNPGRLAGELPDIDMDFPPSIRDEIKQYIAHKYGQDRVANIGTIGVVKVRSAIQKVVSAKEFIIDGVEYDFHKIQKITHTIPNSIGGGVMIETLEDAVGVCKNDENNLFWQFYQKHGEWLKRHLEFIQEHPVNYGRHAAGLVISPIPIDDCIPIRVMDSGGTEVRVSQWRDKDLIPLGFLKLDILGLNTLEQIEFANAQIKKRHNITMPEIGDIDKNDIKVFKRIIQSGRTMGVFQLNSHLFKRYLQELRPVAYEHIYTTTALLRPGPMGIGAHKTYIDLIRGVAQPHYDSEKEIPALEDTGGLVIFQEAAMQLCVDIAGFTLEEADTFRSIVGKKKIDKMPEQKQKFIDGAIGRGIAKVIAEKIFAKIEAFAGYGFNKAHAVAYSDISMYQAWLKNYFAAEFWASKLQFGETNPEHKESVWNTRNQMLLEGHKFAPVSVNTCGDEIRIGNKTGKFYWRLDLIKGVGTMVAVLIRMCAPFVGPVDLFKKCAAKYKQLREAHPDLPKNCPVGKRSLMPLITAGAFDDVCHDGNRFESAKEYMAFYHGKKWEEINRYLDYDEIPEDAPLTAAQRRDLEWVRSLYSPFTAIVLQQEQLRFVSRPYWKMFAAQAKGQRKGDVASVVQRMSPGSHVWMYGVLDQLKERASKRGKLLTGIISEYDGSVPFILFSNDYANHSTMLKKMMRRPVKLGWISGTVQEDRYRGGKQIVANIIGDLLDG